MKPVAVRHVDHPPMVRYASALLAALASGACAPATDPAPAAPAAPADAPSPAAIAPADPGQDAKATPSAPTCVTTPIYRDTGLRDGLPAGSSECQRALESITDGLAQSATCSGDSDCTIQPLAGGCMGAGLVRDAGPTPLPTSCVPDECRAADFTDHQVRCEAGCCVVFES